MDIGDYYSKSFNGFKENPILALPFFIGYILIYGIIFLMGISSIFLLGGMSGFSNFTADAINYANMGYLLILFLVMMVLMIVISSYMSAAMIGMSKSVIKGAMPDLGIGLQNGNKYFLKIIAVSIIIFLLLCVFALPGLMGIIIDRAFGLFPVLTIIGVLVSLILWLVTPVIFIFANQSIVVCGESVIGSLKDSFKLLRKNIGDVIVVLIINLVILICIMALLGFINLFLNIIPILGTILGIILNIIVYSLVYPFLALVLTYVYMDKKGIIYDDPEYVE